MRTLALARGLPWLIPLLIGCGDDIPADGSTSGSLATTGDSEASGGGATMGSNAAPDAVDDVYFARQNEALTASATEGVFANDTDPNGDLLNLADADAVSANGATVVVGQDGSLDYTPAAGFWGPDSFDYTVQDDAGETAVATVTVYVAPVQIPLADVAAGMGGFVLNGEAPGFSRESVSGAGDVNGDGLDDVIVGASQADANGNASGRSYVVFGKADGAAVELGAGGFVLNGEAWGDFSGGSVSGAGDVNGDGMHDLIVGARGAGPNGTQSGRSYVVFGKADGTAVELSALGAGGFVLNGEALGDGAGYSVSGAGDVNGDGMHDLIVGANRAGIPGAQSGRSYVVFGKADTTAVELSALGAGGFALNGEASSDSLGDSVSGAGDVNGDGMHDLIVGATLAAPNGGFSGRSYVVFGKADTTTVELSSLGAGGFVLNREAGFHLGGSVSGAGDVNGDGMDDVIVGARGTGPNGDGRSYVVFGKADGAPVELSALGAGGFVLNGEAGASLGFSVSGAGDVNGDGMDDVIVGAFRADANGEFSGRSYVVFGKADGAAVELSALGMGGFVLNGEAAYDQSGHSVSGAGDVNGDGMDDIIVGAPGAGRSYVVFGVPTAGM